MVFTLKSEQYSNLTSAYPQHYQNFPINHSNLHPNKIQTFIQIIMTLAEAESH